MWDAISAFSQPRIGRELITLSRTIFSGHGSNRLAAPSPMMAITPRTRNFVWGLNRALILSESASPSSFGTASLGHVSYQTRARFRQVIGKLALRKVQNGPGEVSCGKFFRP